MRCSELYRLVKSAVLFGKDKYRVSIKSFPDYKHLLQETLRCTSEEVQPWIIFQQDGAPPHGFRLSSVFGYNISKKVNWERWSDTLATTIAGYHLPSLLFMEVC